MSRRIIDERDSLRRTVARQDARIRDLEAELRRRESRIAALEEAGTHVTVGVTPGDDMDVDHLRSLIYRGATHA